MKAQNPSIGRIFTPLNWAQWLAKKSGAYLAWRSGASVLDPTCGDGAFLEALISIHLQEHASVSSEMLSRLYGIEIVPEDKKAFLQRMKSRYSIEFPNDNFLCSDILDEQADIKCDFLIGNPPWSNFTDLPQYAKDSWADAFIKHGLVKSKKDVLLGKSRADFCALIIKKAIDLNLRANGRASFFAPLSILFNDGANDEFRPHPNSSHGYSITSIWDFEGNGVFDGVATRYGAIDFAKCESQKWPVPTWVQADGEWRELSSTSCDRRSGGWVRHEKGQLATSAPRIIASLDNKPRQGVNTCGANDVFIFSKTSQGLVDKNGNIVDLEADLLFPLMERSIFQASTTEPGEALKWILIPHDTKTGKCLSRDELSKFPKSERYLLQHEQRLRNRKGTIIRTSISKGRWWSLLGVGRYSFARYKVAWEALGQKAFRPVLIDGIWQGNQAMHAFCPCSSKEEGVNIRNALAVREVEAWLKSFSMSGTCNWAQPGKVAKVFDFELEQLTLL